MTIVYFIIALGVLVFVHEFGDRFEFAVFMCGDSDLHRITFVLIVDQGKSI